MSKQHSNAKQHLRPNPRNTKVNFCLFSLFTDVWTFCVRSNVSSRNEGVYGRKKLMFDLCQTTLKLINFDDFLSSVYFVIMCKNPLFFMQITGKSTQLHTRGTQVKLCLCLTRGLIKLITLRSWDDTFFGPVLVLFGINTRVIWISFLIDGLLQNFSFLLP